MCVTLCMCVSFLWTILIGGQLSVDDFEFRDKQWFRIHDSHQLHGTGPNQEPIIVPPVRLHRLTASAIWSSLESWMPLFASKRCGFSGSQCGLMSESESDCLTVKFYYIWISLQWCHWRQLSISVFNLIQYCNEERSFDFFYWLWLWLCHSRATHSILVIMNRSEAVDNAQFHIVILVADGALSNVLIKKYEALLPQLQLHFQWASYIEPENLLHTSIINHHTVSYSIHMYT